MDRREFLIPSPDIRVCGYGYHVPLNITTKDFIEIIADHTTCHIFFTTNGSDPNPAYRRIDGEEITHVYIGPFKLKRGHRIIKALATSKTGIFRSLIASQTFTVKDPLILDNSYIDEFENDSTITESDTSISRDLEIQLSRYRSLSPNRQLQSAPPVSNSYYRRSKVKKSDDSSEDSSSSDSNFFRHTHKLYRNKKDYQDIQFEADYKNKPKSDEFASLWPVSNHEGLLKTSTDHRYQEAIHAKSAIHEKNRELANSNQATQEKQKSASKQEQASRPKLKEKKIIAVKDSSSSSSSDESDEKNKDTSNKNKIPKNKNTVPVFANKSGTQINIWGAEATESLEWLKAANLHNNDSKKMKHEAIGQADKSKKQQNSEKIKTVHSTIPPTATNGPVNEANNSGGSNSKKSHVMASSVSNVNSAMQFSIHSRKHKSHPVAASKQHTAHSAMQYVTHNRQHKLHSSPKNFFRKLFGFNDKSQTKNNSNIPAVTYEQIKAQCVEEKKLWEDPTFPADDSSLFYLQKPEFWPVEWKRPHEICKEPQFTVEGASRLDVDQGVLGNCWLLAAVAGLTCNEKKFNKVVPLGQSFNDNYCGVFRFYFWQYGDWVEICVDDRLPTKNGKLIYMRSPKQNEFWAPLLEKAYAKLASTYESLSGGLITEAMTDFTGGICERFNFKQELPANMFQLMLKSCRRGCLMGCSIDASSGESEEELPNGLIMGHAYTITDVQMIKTNDKEEQLVRVRNPWGDSHEWKGAWSDGSPEWNRISENVRVSMGLTFSHDGEFWMNFRDFSANFNRVEICHLGPEDSETIKVQWNTQLLHNEWKNKISAGGCRNFPETFWTNPQFRVTLKDIDDDDDDMNATVIISLMQKNRRRMHVTGTDTNLTIGYEIYKVLSEHETNLLDKKFFNENDPVMSSPTYINSREICGRHKLPPGNYSIVPTTFEPKEEGEFLLRIFTEKPHSFSEANEKTNIVSAEHISAVHSAPQLSDELNDVFDHYAGESNSIDAYELQQVINNAFATDYDFGGMDINTCRSLVAMANSDRIGYLDKEEFAHLWQLLNLWKTIFVQHDKDQSNYLNSLELRGALKAAGISISNAVLSALVTRYSDKNGQIHFVDFIACVARVKTMFDTFQAGSHKSDGQVTFALEDFMMMTVYS